MNKNKIFIISLMFLVFSCTSNSSEIKKNEPKVILQIPESNQGTTPEVTGLWMISGKIYDKDKNPLIDVRLTIESLDQSDIPSISKDRSKLITDEKGDFVIQYLKIGSKIKLKLSKQGFKSKEKIIDSKEKLSESITIINFGGNDNNDFLEKE